MHNFNKTYELLGFIQGDGQLTDLNNMAKRGIGINIGRDDMDVKDYFELPLEVGARVIYHQDYALVDMIRELKFSLNHLPERDLPSTFNDWSSVDKNSFMRGLYSANGSIIKSCGRITFKTTNRRLADDMKSYWMSIGLNPYITTNKSKDVKFANGTYTCRESYDLNFGRRAEVEWFSKNIGFIQKYKNDKISDFLNSRVFKAKYELAI